MYCTNCGYEMNAADRFCARCGQAAGGPQAPPPYPERERLARDMGNKKIAGVCAGIARYLGWDVTLVRVAFLAAVVFKGFGLLAYLIAWICMPAGDRRTAQPPPPPSQAAQTA